MVDLARSLSVMSDGSLINSAPIQYYRAPHDLERANVNAGDFQYLGDGNHSGKIRAVVTTNNKPYPEVYRLQPDHQTPLNCAFQKLWRNLNPQLDDDHWSTLGGNGLAFCNHGCGFPNRYNCITGENFGKPLLTFDAARVCGGALLKGVESNGNLFIESILTDKPVPDAAEVLAKPWLWFWMTSVNPKREVNFVVRKAIDGTMIPVRIPLITRLSVYLPLSQLDRLPLGATMEATDLAV